jgi:hypothetical protein
VNPYAALLVGNWSVVSVDYWIGSADFGETTFTANTVDGLIYGDMWGPDNDFSWNLDGNLLVISTTHPNDETIEIFSRITFLNDDAFVMELIAMKGYGLLTPPNHWMIKTATRLP